MRWGLWLGPLVMILLLVCPFSSLTPEQHRLAAIMGLVIIYWVTEAIPLAATGFLGPLLCVLLGVGKDKAVFAPLADPIILQFIGTFMLAAAMEKYRLDRRFALKLACVPWVGKSPVRLYGALAGLTGFLSMWMSNAATTAMMIPIALGALAAWPALKNHPTARGSLVLLIAFSASIGGQGTPVGTPPNMMGLGFIRQMLQVDISFIKWMMMGVPLALVQLIFLIWFMRPRLSAVEKTQPDQNSTRFMHDQLKALGSLSRGEVNTLAIFFITIAFWVIPGILDILGGESALWAKKMKTYFPEAMVGLMSGLLLLILPLSWRTGEKTLRWQEAVKIDWGTIFMFAGGMALGNQLFESGLAKKMGETVANGVGHPGVWTLTLIGIVLSLAMSEAASNTASANVMVPVMIAVAQGANVDPLPVALASCLACSFGFLLPVSTGPNAIAYGTGQVSIRQMMRYGFWLDVVGIITIFGIVRLVYPLLR
jgi:sodium-dependent dicarboxylate transporter 2/3/5